MKFITLLSAAYVGGALRHPHEGSIPVSDDDAKRLVDENLAVDDTDGFTEDQMADVPEESITIASGPISSTSAENPHLSQVAPAPIPEAKPGRKPASKE
ncbi:hypothetical protein [Sphingomonas hylomeconis]|uniref:Uncharacterized protein n=1 Tax=Sphingomonas hylomeconis TaxID=1395958 RepID=A0ABV7SQC2_9SPHN|nr:hypothetical protein [Sphingomonas hylomeconis]